MCFLPDDLSEMIPEGHMVRVVDAVVDKMSLGPLLAQYKGGGASAYHPLLMLKVLMYAYADGIYSSRQIAKAVRENIHYMWLAGRARPDFMTINRFRSERLKDVIQPVFGEVVMLLHAEGYVSLDKYFVDGTKIESVAGKDTAIWQKNTQRYKAQVLEKLRGLFAQIETINRQENEALGDKDLPETGGQGLPDNAVIEEAARRIEEQFKAAPENEALAKAKRQLEEVLLPRYKKYEAQEALLAGRNSASKTDPDATFMQMKEKDAMHKNPLKPGYNVQMGTEGQIITGFSVHQTSTDTTTLIDHMNGLPFVPRLAVGDAGFGSEENYAYLAARHIEAYVKYNYFHKEQTAAWQNDGSKVQNFVYDAATNSYYCPLMHRRLAFMGEEQKRSRNGYESTVRVYECESCAGCPHRKRCLKSENPDAKRTIRINERLNKAKQEARRRLDSPEGRALRKQRNVEVESVFGDIKGNHGRRRFTLRGLAKVTLEYGLWALGHNMRKLTKATQGA
jgi:transposase